MKHTKGPWYSEQNGIFTKQGARFIAEMASNQKNSFVGNKDEQEANARLIAAAPEMYRLLHAIWSKTDPSKDPKTCRAIANLLDQVDETIKARGAK
jgi:hypothetical protein